MRPLRPRRRNDCAPPPARTRRRRVTAAVGLAGLLLAACLGDDDAGTVALDNPCEVFTKAEVAEHLNIPDTAEPDEHVTVGEPMDSGMIPFSRMVGVEVCRYRAVAALDPERGAAHMWTALVTEFPSETFEEYKDTFDDEVTDLDGLGDDAYWAGDSDEGGQLVVLVDDAILGLMVDEPPTRERATRLVDVALSGR